MHEIPGEKLKALRLSKGLTQQELADAIHRKRDTLASWERSSVKKGRDVKAIVDYFNLEVDNAEIEVANDLAMQPSGLEVTDEEYDRAEPVEELDESDEVGRIISRNFSPIAAAALWVIGKAFSTPLDKADLDKLEATHVQTTRIIYRQIESLYDLDAERRQEVQPADDLARTA